uniref:N/A n=1 Tax=Ganoderma boninense TaxID=34458 RepID=A0A5K1JW31_9APHY|nr:N/A [Ganoderma boninense]
MQWQKESAALREELAEERARRTALDTAFAAYKLESEAALAANAETAKQKDAQIGQLEESLSALTARVQEQATVVDRQTTLSQDQAERIQELEEREVRWAAHMKEMLAELPGSSISRLRDRAASDEEEAGGLRKRVKLA